MVEMGNFPKFNFKSWCVLLSWLYWSFACKSKCIKCNNIEFASTTHIRVIRLRLWESDFINLFELIQFYLSKQQANSANLWIRSDKEISKGREGDDREAERYHSRLNIETFVRKCREGLEVEVERTARKGEMGE